VGCAGGGGLGYRWYRMVVDERKVTRDVSFLVYSIFRVVYEIAQSHNKLALIYLFIYYIYLVFSRL
jgi:Ca2+/Na+ antiporter